ncbi:MAG TPA: ThuA domain-containing protein [Solirubrobacteraceae bacterium]|nr:ThuA domain-containing protein [Solirubrobacteraceae bacterium]
MRLMNRPAAGRERAGGAGPIRVLRALGACAVLALALVLAVGAPARAQTPEPKQVLLFVGPEDATSEPSVDAFLAIEGDDFTVDATEDPTAFTADNLANYDTVVFSNTAGDLLDDEQEAAMTGFIEDGGGFLGIGSAAQSEPGTDFFNGLIGARPSGNSSTDEAEMTVAVGDRVHPSTRDLPLEWDRTDVWYQWQSRPTGQVHTVARYHATNAPAGDGTSVGGTDHPISWCRDYRGGRSFYTGMGRTAEAFAEEGFRDHLAGALRWTTGLERAGCKATIAGNYEGEKIVAAASPQVGLANSGESHGLVAAPNGWVLYIGRGDCRTDEERGLIAKTAGPLARVFDHADEKVGIGCGSVHVWDPAEADGTLNSGITRAGTLAVYGDGGQGGERTDEGDHKMEYGLIGITVAPDFEETGHVYLQYFPSFDPESTPPGLPESRRISKMSEPRISRFTMDMDTKQLDLSSEVVIFKYDAQIYSCCHVGGGMGFDSDGNLYVTTGDTNSSQNLGASDANPGGYSGNNPVAKCPVGPNNVASSDHCGSANYSYQDARRTAGNTNDYNGKMLRFRPIPELEDGSTATPGVGSTYTLPDEESPNGPNLFDGTEGGGGKAKPEIYAMGLRNPSRLYVDPETDIPYTAWVGPDAGGPSRIAGPSTYENAAQITHAGNYGWPYCMGNGQAYRDRVADGSLRTTNAPGYVSGGPASGGTDGWYDCNNIHNDSPNNTGLVEFPHETGTGMDAGKQRHVNLWYSRGNPGSANGCPVYPRPRGETAAPDYGATNPTQLCPYLRNDGMTVMAGPVYRYDEDATDDSRRWPAYWDGRWFLHNSGGPSAKHALLFDQDTAGEGGQPVYADSFRDVLNWDASYMDSKFGADGALYVQVYEGFFRAEQNAGIWRFDYTGGADTPGANPQAFPRGGNLVAFSSDGSGGIAYEWDFGDGSPVSTEADPSHQYASPGVKTVTLTVTYEGADGETVTDTKEIQVDVIATVDEDAPTTTATTNPADPNGTKPVTVSLSATDGDGLGVSRTEYRINEGPWTEYTVPFRLSEPAEYTVDYRSIDQANNVEDAKQLTFTISVIQNCDPDLNDEFDGTSLGSKWERLNPDDTALSVGEGYLDLEIREGDVFGDQATAKNILLQEAPDGPFMVTTRLDVRDLSGEGQQAGLVLWNGTDPNTFAKIVYINKGSFRQFEYVATREDQFDIRVGPNFQTSPREAYLRVRADGDGYYIAEGSIDGETWQQISDPIENLGDPEDLKIGLKVSAGDDAESRARFLYFRVDCSDRIEPDSSASIAPAQADGKLGWYSEPPLVTLDATDRGSDVGSISYTIDDGPTQQYSAPFRVTGDGDHEVRYWATDTAAEPNVESANTLGVRVDGTAPVTAINLARPQGQNGPVDVTLDPDDGSGSGTVLTQYRVDNGPWKAYASEDEQIFDGSAGSFAQWAHDGDGGFELLGDDSGGIGPTPSGGLGMLWYPVKAYGDFRLKLEFREGREDGGFSNGGVFVRFPDPRTPVAERPQCGRTGNAAGAPEWVAIQCGHEIQLYDGQTGEERKTGSIYTFDNNTIEEIGPQSPFGEWNDYEVEVIGQTYRVFRNGELIKTYENSPDKVSDRGGDPPASQRQFAQGFIGLQNHGGPDRMDYRNIRVQDLSPDAPGKSPTGAFKVTGAGPHTVEVRSIDAAGNVEAKKALDFEIGQVAPPASGEDLDPVPPITDEPATAALGEMASRMGSKKFGKQGITVRVACTGAMEGTATLKLNKRSARALKVGKRTVKTKAVKCYGAHTAKVKLKPSKSLKRKLAKWRKSGDGPSTLTLKLTVAMTDLGQPTQTLKKKITIRP